MSVSYSCNRCGAAIPKLIDGIVGPDKGKGIEINIDNLFFLSRELYYKAEKFKVAHLCYDCHIDHICVTELWATQNKKFIAAVNAIVEEINDRNRLLDGDDDDHTSAWGGAGPDCIAERREAAHQFSKIQ